MKTAVRSLVAWLLYPVSTCGAVLFSLYAAPAGWPSWAVGAAVLAVQELLKQPIQKFSSIGYTLKGSWDDPQIAEPSAEQ